VIAKGKSKADTDVLKATFTGKKIEDGGSEGREEATGLGGLFVLLAILAKIRTENSTLKTVAVQGFGNVGFNVAKFLVKEGFTVVAVSDSKGGIFLKDGIDVEATLQSKKTSGTLSCNKASVISNKELLELPVDILIPSALENVITSENANNIKAKIILEMANGPTTVEADEIFATKNIPVIPDILANSGGVATSYFEWYQNMHGQHWDKELVLQKLEAHMLTAWHEVVVEKEKYATTFRVAAYIVATQRIIGAMHASQVS
jgi:glutamate dehydrogenase/leucine dehydrogenase